MDPQPDGYQSPLSWRYGSSEMRVLWGERQKRVHWRKVWAALAHVSAEFDLISPTQAADISAHVEDIDLKAATKAETELRHDLMAELVVFSAQCKVGGGVIHLGATSMDIEDNAEVLRQQAALDLIISRLSALLGAFAGQMRKFATLPVIAYTHLQPAEPTTLGYRFAFYAQDFLTQLRILKNLRNTMMGKGFKGAVGSAASYHELLGETRFSGFETRLSGVLGIPFFPVTHQTYPRSQDYQVLCQLAACAIPAAKFAYDLRLLQSPSIGEWQEPFSSRQVGSSAMPFKRNPITAEKINSLSRWLSALPAVAWENAANSFLERTLDDSANRRAILPEAFLLLEEILLSSHRLVSDLRVNEAEIRANLDRYAPFAAVEKLLLALTRTGMDRNAAHEHLRQLSMQAWEQVRLGNNNPLISMCRQDHLIAARLSTDALSACFDIHAYTGLATTAALALVGEIEAEIG